MFWDLLKMLALGVLFYILFNLLFVLIVSIGCKIFTGEWLKWIGNSSCRGGGGGGGVDGYLHDNAQSPMTEADWSRAQEEGSWHD